MAYTSGYLVVFATVMIAIALIARIAEWRHHPRAVLTAFLIATVVTVVLVRRSRSPTVASPSNRTWSARSKRDRLFGKPDRLHRCGGSRALLHLERPVLRESRRFVLPRRGRHHPVRVRVVARYPLGNAPIAAPDGRRHRARRIRAVAWTADAAVRVALRGVPADAGLRAAARFGNLFLLAMAILAGLGLAVLRQTSPRRWLTPAAIAAVVLVNLEALRAPFSTGDSRGSRGSTTSWHRRPVRWCSPKHRSTANAVFANAEYVLNSTRHWRPLMNGYSGYARLYRRVAWTFWAFRRNTRSRPCATPA